jgi:hypothetical protein
VPFESIFLNPAAMMVVEAAVVAADAEDSIVTVAEVEVAEVSAVETEVVVVEVAEEGSVVVVVAAALSRGKELHSKRC